MRKATSQTILLVQIIMKELRRFALPTLFILTPPAASVATNYIGEYLVNDAISRMEIEKGQLETYNAAKDYRARIFHMGSVYHIFGGWGKAEAASDYMLRIHSEGNSKKAKLFARENPVEQLDNYVYTWF